MLISNCIVCKRPILGNHYKDWAGNCVCESHYNNVISCFSCGQFCDSASSVIDGRHLCRYCMQHLITKEESKYVVNYVKNVFRNSIIGEITGWNLKVIDFATITKKTGNPHVRGFAEQNGLKYTIYVYRYLSKVVFAEVLAHELLHIWQYKHNISADLYRTEGFCNLGSYVVAKSIRNNDEAMYVIKKLNSDFDPIYGEGFRYMKFFYDKGGWKAAIEELINTSKPNSNTKSLSPHKVLPVNKLGETFITSMMSLLSMAELLLKKAQTAVKRIINGK